MKGLCFIQPYAVKTALKLRQKFVLVLFLIRICSNVVTQTIIEINLLISTIGCVGPWYLRRRDLGSLGGMLRLAYDSKSLF